MKFIKSKLAYLLIVLLCIVFAVVSYKYNQNVSTSIYLFDVAIVTTVFSVLLFLISFYKRIHFAILFGVLMFAFILELFIGIRNFIAFDILVVIPTVFILIYSLVLMISALYKKVKYAINSKV